MPARLNVIDASQRAAARVAALACLISFALVVSANFGLRGGLYVGSNMAETVRRVALAEPMFRLSLLFDILYCVGVGVLLASLYVVLSPVNRHLALLASVLKLIYGLTAVLMVLSHLNVVGLATHAAYQQALGPESLHAIVRLNWAALWSQYYVGLVFWALSATIFAWLWLKSRYVPAPLAAFGIASAAWCALCTLAYIFNPQFSSIVNLWWFDTPLVLFDITLSFWLLFKGLRVPSAPAAVSDSLSTV